MSSDISEFERIPTRIKGFDTLLKGGFLKGGVYLIMGAPGAGKTIIANQLAFNHAEQGGRSLYVTLLAETQSRMFGNLKPLSFFDESAISDSVVYLGGYGTLEKEGLNGLLKMLGEAIRKFKTTLLFIDGIASAEEVAADALSFKKFVHQLNSVLSTSGCTTFLLSSIESSEANPPEHTMVDGIIGLTMASDGMRNLREIEVRKFRGSSHLQGRHLLRISDQGVSVFPRIESYLGRPPANAQEVDERRPFGIRKLDEMLLGGLVSGSTSSLLGPAGSGKTILGTQFLLNGAKKGEPGLYLGFYESPVRWKRKMQKMSLDMDQCLSRQTLDYIWYAQLEHDIDEVADKTLENVKRRGVKRLFIDGIGGLRAGMFNQSRLHRALGALSNELRSLEVTTLFTEETELFAKEVSAPISDLSAVTDNVIFLRHVEINSELRRFISVIKTRESGSDRRIHEIQLSEKGFLIGDPIPNFERLMSGAPTPRRGRAATKGRGAARKRK